MGNMLFELLNSQVLGATHNTSLHDDLSAAEAFTYYPERASSKTLIHMLEGTSSTAREVGDNLDSFYTTSSIFHEHKKRRNIPISSDEEIGMGGSNGDDIRHRVNNLVLSSSTENPQPFATHLRESYYPSQHSSMSQNSGASSSLGSGGQTGTPDEARLLQFSAALDESSTSTSTHGPFSSKPTKLSAQVVSVQTEFTLHAADLERGESKKPAVPERKKRKRTKACKDSEAVESQRMAHIAVERNRRKQMNEHLSALRSLMPTSYVQRGDQASIIGGAIEFVKELEEILFSLQIQKHKRDYGDWNMTSHHAKILSSDFITSPHLVEEPLHSCVRYANDSSIYEPTKELFVESKSLTANVEVTMLGSSAIVKILAPKRPQQLLHTLVTLKKLQLTIVHMNITTTQETVLYSFNIEVGVESKIQLVSELAISIQKIFNVSSTQSLNKSMS